MSKNPALCIKLEPNYLIFPQVQPLELVGKHVKARHEEVEHLLTYFGKPKAARKKLKSIPRGRLRIENTGWKGPLPKEIIYPVALVK